MITLTAMYPVQIYATLNAIPRVGCGTGPNAYDNVCAMRATPTTRNKFFAVQGLGFVIKYKNPTGIKTRIFSMSF